MSSNDEKLKEQMAEALIEKTSAIIEQYHQPPLLEKIFQLQQLTKREKKKIKTVMYLSRHIFRLVQLGQVKKAVPYYVFLQKVHAEVVRK